MNFKLLHFIPLIGASFFREDFDFEGRKKRSLEDQLLSLKEFSGIELSLKESLYVTYQSMVSQIVIFAPLYLNNPSYT